MRPCNEIEIVSVEFSIFFGCMIDFSFFLLKKGVVLINKEVADRLLPKFSRLLAERQQSVEPVEYGSIAELKELVSNVASGAVS